MNNQVSLEALCYLCQERKLSTVQLLLKSRNRSNHNPEDYQPVLFLKVLALHWPVTCCHQGLARMGFLSGIFFPTAAKGQY